MFVYTHARIYTYIYTPTDVATCCAYTRPGRQPPPPPPPPWYFSFFPPERGELHLARGASVAAYTLYMRVLKFFGGRLLKSKLLRSSFGPDVCASPGLASLFFLSLSLKRGFP